MIKGLRPSLAEAGKIKIGGLGDVRQSAGGKAWRAPVKYDYFEITKTYRTPGRGEAQGDLIIDKEIMQALAPYRSEDGKLRQIPILLHSDDIDLVFPHHYAAYSNKRLACKGDGETATRFNIVGGKSTGESKKVSCTCPLLEEKKCKPNGTLYASINVPGHAVAGSIYTWRTTSIISIQQLVGSLQQIQSITGVLQGLPLVLVVRPVETSHGTSFVCHIELRAADLFAAQDMALQLAKHKAEHRKQLAGYETSYRALLTAGESEEEQEAVQQEFYPEEQTPPPVEDTGNRVAALKALVGSVMSDPNG